MFHDIFAGDVYYFSENREVVYVFLQLTLQFWEVGAF